MCWTIFVWHVAHAFWLFFIYFWNLYAYNNPWDSLSITNNQLLFLYCILLFLVPSSEMLAEFTLAIAYLLAYFSGFLSYCSGPWFDSICAESTKMSFGGFIQLLIMTFQASLPQSRRLSAGGKLTEFFQLKSWKYGQIWCFGMVLMWCTDLALLWGLG